MKKPTFIICISALLIILVTTACSGDRSLRIAVSKASSNYIMWLKKADTSIEIIDMYYMKGDSAAFLLTGCAGLILTGGEDVFPGWYGKEEDTAACTGFDRRRDSLEMRLISRALELQLPVLGICRGNQILNTYMNGTLLVHIPRDVGDPVPHQCDDITLCRHPVSIKPNTLLRRISGTDSGMVNTNHHQAIATISPVLRVNTVSPDGVIEGMEWLNRGTKGFLMGVQWHPERMDTENPLSGPIRDTFLMECRNYRAKIMNR